MYLFYYFIDHVVVFQKDGVPVPINTADVDGVSDIEYLEDLEVPPDSQM